MPFCYPFPLPSSFGRERGFVASGVESGPQELYLLNIRLIQKLGGEGHCDRAVARPRPGATAVCATAERQSPKQL